MPRSPSPPYRGGNSRPYNDRDRERSPPSRRNYDDRDRPGFRDRPFRPAGGGNLGDRDSWNRNDSRSWNDYRGNDDYRDRERGNFRDSGGSRGSRGFRGRGGYRDRDRDRDRDWQDSRPRSRSRSRSRSREHLRERPMGISSSASVVGQATGESSRRASPTKSRQGTPEEGQITSPPPSSSSRPLIPRSPIPYRSSRSPPRSIGRRSISPPSRGYRDRDREGDRDEREYPRLNFQPQPRYHRDYDRPPRGGYRGGRGRPGYDRDRDRDRSLRGDYHNRSPRHSRSPSFSSHSNSRFSSPVKREVSPNRDRRSPPPPIRESVPAPKPEAAKPIKLPPSGPRSDRLPPTGPRALVAPIVPLASSRPAVQPTPPKQEDIPPIPPSPPSQLSQATTAPAGHQSNAGPSTTTTTTISSTPPGGPRMSWSDRKRLSPIETKPQVNPYLRQQDPPSPTTRRVSTPMQVDSPTPIRSPGERAERQSQSQSQNQQQLQPQIQMQPIQPVSHAPTEVDLAERRAREEEARILTELPALKVDFGNTIWETELSKHHAAMYILNQNTSRAQAGYRIAAAVLADAETERIAAMERRQVVEAQLMAGTLGMGLLGGVQGV